MTTDSKSQPKKIARAASARDEVVRQLRELGCDPIEGMALIAMNEDNATELRGRMFSELAQYLYPKIRAVELTGANGMPLEMPPTQIIFRAVSADESNSDS